MGEENNFQIAPRVEESKRNNVYQYEEQMTDTNIPKLDDNQSFNYNSSFFYPSNIQNDKYIQEFYQYDFIPRLQKYSGLPQDTINQAKNIYQKTPITTYYKASGVGGTTARKMPFKVRLNRFFKPSREILTHELSHASRGRMTDKNNISGYSKKEAKKLYKAYNLKGLGFSDNIHERGATNTEIRYRFWKHMYDILGRRPTIDELDNYLKGFLEYNKKPFFYRFNRLKGDRANDYIKKALENEIDYKQMIQSLIEVAQNNNGQQQLYAKYGGILQFLKNGSGIHIKKENRGKFTDYCGGKVTSECIAKGKRSSNPAIRKRATFADNARHFKHRLGGSIVEAFKLRRQILSSLNNMIND